MNEKKDPSRYTLRFYDHNPEHRIVIDLLNSLGRRKSDYIVKAIVHYRRCSKAKTEADLDERLKAYILELVQDTLAQQQGVKKAKKSMSAKSTLLGKSEVASAEINSHENSENSLSEDDIDSIISSVSNFRK